MFSRYYKQIEKRAADLVGGYAVHELDKLGVDVVGKDGKLYQVKYGKKLDLASIRKYVEVGITVIFIPRRKKIAYIISSSDDKATGVLSSLMDDQVNGVFKTPRKSFTFKIDTVDLCQGS